MKADVVVRHLFYTSKIMFTVLEINQLKYKHVCCIYAMKAFGLELNHLIYIHVYCIYIRNES